MIDSCPKCGYQRQAPDAGDVGICARCGLVFAKWVERQAGVTPLRANAPVRAEAEDEASPAARVWRELIYVPERTDPMVFWGRVALYLGIFVWGWYFILLDFRTAEIGHSFMHRINLVFHEAGHIIFMPFGNFMMVLEYERQIAWLADALGTVLVLAALCWGAYVLYLQYHREHRG